MCILMPMSSETHGICTTADRRIYDSANVGRNSGTQNSPGQISYHVRTKVPGSISCLDTFFLLDTKKFFQLLTSNVMFIILYGWYFTIIHMCFPWVIEDMASVELQNTECMIMSMRVLILMPRILPDKSVGTIGLGFDS